MMIHLPPQASLLHILEDTLNTVETVSFEVDVVWTRATTFVFGGKQFII